LTPDGSQDPGRKPRAAASDRQADAPASSAPQASWLASLQGLVHELPGLVSDRIELLSLELQRAGQVLAQVVALIVAAAILAVTAWLALWAGVMVALIGAGLHWAAASLVVLVINLGACWWAVVRVRALAPLLALPATRRHLTLAQPSTATHPPPSDEHTEHRTAASAEAH
jgi:uncharacterized membrane protein YqjE